MFFRSFCLLFLLSTSMAVNVFAQDNFISSGNLTQLDTSRYRNFTLSAGDTLFLTPGNVGVIYACQNIVIDGVIMGVGAGFQAPPNPIPAMGTGPGGGQAGSISGAGGGGYGGAGGNGGYDSSDPINAGGLVYGTSNSMDIAMGSSGGTAAVVRGGNGGGAIYLNAPNIQITGILDVSGADGQMPGGGQGAGGGAGGGVLLIGRDLNVSGGIFANGADGSIGTSSANDDGGGGGGGRIKLFYETSISNTGTLSVNGGMGGINGSVSPGEPGQMGTVAAPLTSMNMFLQCAAIPTMSQWGMFILFLVLSIASVVAIKKGLFNLVEG